ncbi:hypothetical protein BATDEDRAFT_90148 [Batrachochytrium dendrobatidis JAM81]|uniref:SH3 domain-containing protein n=1 Tax=Batrachochytrium dendrobatidis (strain JAM81 / FGSC 10211) TaxID=684364 RepID=F4P7J0_BATDJ|nr:uncharacterized protein BATDEDRAFT_90148 [Batrachochytrium dendrobatidis JAM81]EGF79137.1 hypothetical protein BATDEDRAFT_90148 [Batrachochytrium dendrobatidis JAM81]|eukprot:XP_006680590.1 hypothetical protein BATDEDRAFT_90148 [Batrachochytrium dendrobatidis JAM81]
MVELIASTTSLSRVPTERMSRFTAHTESLTTSLQALCQALQLSEKTALLAPPFELLAINIQNVCELVCGGSYDSLLDVHEGVLALQTETYASCVKILKVGSAEYGMESMNPLHDTDSAMLTQHGFKSNRILKRSTGLFNAPNPLLVSTFNSQSIASGNTAGGKDTNEHPLISNTTPTSATSSSSNDSAIIGLKISHEYHNGKPTTLEEWRHFHECLARNTDSPTSLDNAQIQHTVNHGPSNPTLSKETLSSSTPAPTITLPAYIADCSPDTHNDHPSATVSTSTLNHPIRLHPIAIKAPTNASASAILSPFADASSEISGSCGYTSTPDQYYSLPRLPSTQPNTALESPSLHMPSQTLSPISPKSSIQKLIRTSSLKKPKTKSNEKEKRHVRFVQPNKSSDVVTDSNGISKSDKKAESIWPTVTSSSKPDLHTLYDKVITQVKHPLDLSTDSSADPSTDSLAQLNTPITATSSHTRIIAQHILSNVPVNQVTPVDHLSSQRSLNVVVHQPTEIHSFVASVVDANSVSKSVLSSVVPVKPVQTVETPNPDKPTVKCVMAKYDYKARTAKEMSFQKGDVMVIRKRQETWLYGTLVDKHTLKPTVIANHQDTGTISSRGWIPVAFVVAYTPNSNA